MIMFSYYRDGLHREKKQGRMKYMVDWTVQTLVGEGLACSLARINVSLGTAYRYLHTSANMHILRSGCSDDAMGLHVNLATVCGEPVHWRD